MKTLIRRVPLLGDWLTKQYWELDARRRPRRSFPGTATYWEARYATKGDSGVGSYGKFAEFKADFLNDFVATRALDSVIEWGCGDGHQLSLARYPRYLGIDVSREAVSLCEGRFARDPTKTFCTVDNYQGQTGDVALSLDVIYHLVEDTTYDTYMRSLFASATQFVIVYSSNMDDNRDTIGTHVLHRVFTSWVEQNEPQWNLLYIVPNRYPYRGDYTTGSWSDFFVYGRA